MSNLRKLKIFPEAVADLERLREFIKIHNPTAANRSAKSIREAIHKIPHQPFLGHPIATIENPELRERFIPFGKSGYWVEYLVKPEEIHIVKIWHSRENREKP
ncbi:type II toxin-antitoxin system RelE/ParE family toxin [Methylovulum psychrotolerans]|uniref:Plasmid stabilization protein n=1 Tax=Methylovulum psychrotolerans TaxID=1704499 RepID=A0A1Z4C3K1_9GAMM|nr:type II toxin-antitoxin system RelE/ParE family toxin [Methylovulum psychrotolerans]ASF48112.1 plasmid stabilization protein [Methylovulum psychrotolerans]